MGNASAIRRAMFSREASRNVLLRYAWPLWEYSWRAPEKAGPYTLMVRATDARGRVQPAKHDPDHRNALVNHVLPVEVEVR